MVPEFVCRTLDNINEPLSIEHAEKYEGLVNLLEPLDYFDYEPWMRNYLADASMQNPHHPLRFEGLSVRNRVKLVLAARWQKPEGGAMAEFKTRFGPFMKRYTPAEDGLIIELSVELPARVVPVADKAAFNRLIELTRSQATFRVRATEGNPEISRTDLRPRTVGVEPLHGKWRSFELQWVSINLFAKSCDKVGWANAPE